MSNFTIGILAADSGIVNRESGHTVGPSGRVGVGLWGGEGTATENAARWGEPAVTQHPLPRRDEARGGAARRWLALLALLAVLLLAAALPWLSGGVDIYAHLLWTHQAMRCLAAGELPLWAPDLNGGFGSPGIRLYSPAGPAAAAVLGLLLGSAGAGLRSLLVLAAAGILALARRGRGGWVSGALVLLGTPFLADLVVRAAWAQMLAVPLAWWLLEGAVEGERLTAGPVRAGVVTAALWLVHAPTAVMVAALAALAMLLRLGAGAAAWGVRWAGTAAALTAWHWLPLVDEMRLTSAREGLTAGIFDLTRNWLGSPAAHMPGLNTALSLAALGLAAVLLVLVGSGVGEASRVRWILVTVSLALATVLVVPLVRLGFPLGWLQFPWRWLTPAALLLAVPAATVARRRPVLLLLWLAPALALPHVPPISPPPLTAADGWPAVGETVAAFGGNPLAVDVIEHRPPWYAELAGEIQRFGREAEVVADPPASARVILWKPLHRVVEVQAAAPAVLRLRLLRYPWWTARLDGRPAPIPQRGAVLALPVPPGRHTVEVRWGGNPLSRVGLAITAAFLLGCLLRARSAGSGPGTAALPSRP